MTQIAVPVFNADYHVVDDCHADFSSNVIVQQFAVPFTQLSAHGNGVFIK